MKLHFVIAVCAFVAVQVSLAVPIPEQAEKKEVAGAAGTAPAAVAAAGDQAPASKAPEARAGSSEAKAGSAEKAAEARVGLEATAKPAETSQSHSDVLPAHNKEGAARAAPAAPVAEAAPSATAPAPAVTDEKKS